MDTREVINIAHKCIDSNADNCCKCPYENFDCRTKLIKELLEIIEMPSVTSVWPVSKVTTPDSATTCAVTNDMTEIKYECMS